MKMSLEQRRGARGVDRSGFENRCAFTGTVGSNPTLSANLFISMRYRQWCRVVEIRGPGDWRPVNLVRP